VISADDVTLDLIAAVGAFTDPNAGTGKTVLVSGLTPVGSENLIRPQIGGLQRLAAEPLRLVLPPLPKG
jgi:hypothetical protein